MPCKGSWKWYSAAGLDTTFLSNLYDQNKTGVSRIISFSSFYFFSFADSPIEKPYLFRFHLGRATRMNKVSSCFWSEVTDGQLLCWKIHPHPFVPKTIYGVQMVEACLNRMTRHRQTIKTLYRYWAILLVLQVFSKHKEKNSLSYGSWILPKCLCVSVFTLVSSLS